MRRATLSFFEIPGSNPATLATFFEEVFGWQSLSVPWEGPEYVRLIPPPSAEPPGGGILRPDGSGLVDRLTVMIRIEGETLENALARIVAHGGSVALAPRVIAGGRFARFFDPEGNSFGLWQSLPAGPPEEPGDSRQTPES
ncbi:MAG: VOC family protein [Thermoanaerobaculia bacterium]